MPSDFSPRSASARKDLSVAKQIQKRNRRKLSLERLESRRLLAVFIVDTFTDSATGTCGIGGTGNNGCSLRSAIIAANAAPGADTINLPVGTYTLSLQNSLPVVDQGRGDLNITDSLTIRSTDVNLDPTTTIVDAGQIDRVFSITAATTPITVVLSGITIQNGLAPLGLPGGGIEAGNNTNLELRSTVVQNNRVDSSVANGGDADGGGIATDGNLLLDDVSLVNNFAEAFGGGIAMFSAATLSIRDSLIGNNTAGLDGGGIWAGNGENYQINLFEMVTIDGNQAGTASRGGGMYVDGGNTAASVSLSLVDFSGNRSGDAGGGAYIQGVATFNQDRGSFQNNQSSDGDGFGGGGGLYLISNGTSTVDGTSFRNNVSVSGGGGAAILTNAALRNTVFDGNRTTSNAAPGTLRFDDGGGAIAIASSVGIVGPTVRIENSSILNNTAPLAGGIGAVNSNVDIVDTTIQGNTATDAFPGAGGIGFAQDNTDGVTANRVRLTIAGSKINTNISSADAGGIGVADADVTITDSTISGNQSSGRGAGVGIIGINNSPNLRLDRVTVDNNTADTNGGGIAVVEASYFTTNTTISNNSASNNGGGIFFATANPILTGAVEFSTIASNRAGVVGSNVAVNGSVTRFLSSIVSDPLGNAPIINIVSGGPGEVTSQGFNIFAESNFSNPSPSDLLAVDPLLGPLADNGGSVRTRALLTGSPAIDAGANAPLVVDARGLLRPTDGDGNSIARNDIGAFEASAVLPVQTDLVIQASLETTSGTPIPPAGARTGDTIVYRFTINNDIENSPIIDDAASGVTVVTTLPVGVTFVSGTFGSGSFVTFNSTTREATAIVGNVNRGTPVTVLVTVTVNADAPSTITTTSTVFNSPDTDRTAANDTASVFTNISRVVDLAVVTTGPASVQSGGATITYNLTISNLGPSTATNVSVFDDLPAGVTFVSATRNGGAVSNTASNGDFGFVIPSVLSGSANTQTVTINVAVSPNATGTLTNTTTVTTTGDTNTTNNASTITTTINSAGSLVLIDDRIAGTAGQPISFDVATILANDSLGGVIAPPSVQFSAFFFNFVSSGSIETNAGGTLSIAGSQLVYTPPTKFFGNDRFNYRLVSPDGTPSSNTATVTIDVISANLLVSTILGDPRITISNARIVGGDGGQGLFVNGTSEGLPIDSGVILSTGFVGRAQVSGGSIFSPTGLGAPGDDSLAALLPTTGPNSALVETFDASTLEFDFIVPIATRISFEFIFASNEYNEFVDDIFNDVFAIFLDGQNIAKVPGTNSPIAINNVNLLRNSSFYNDNETEPRFATAFDGFTTVLEATSGVLVPGQTYRMKIAIADVEDSDFDSAVLFRTRSLGLGEGDLVVSATQSQSSVPIGETITYTYNLVNNGPSVATNTVFAVTTPLGSTLVSATSTSGVINTSAGGIRLEIGDLAVAQPITVQVVVTAPNTSTELTTISSISSSQFDTDFSNSTASLTTIVGFGFAAIRGQVTCDSNENGTVDSGEEAPNVTVFVDLNGNRLFDFGENSTLTDNLGNYRFSRADLPVDGKANVVVKNPPSCRAVAPEIGVTRTAISTGALSRSITAADMDSDGDNDLLVVNELGNDVSVLINGGSAGFTSSSPIQVGKRPIAIASWQASPSSAPVIAVAAVGTNANKGSIYVIEDGRVSRELSAGNGPVAVVVDDFNGDQQADFVAATLRSGTIVGRMSGEITERVLATARSPKSVTTARINDDNFTDLVVVSYGFDGDESSEVIVLLGDGRGNFTSQVQSIPGGGAVDLATGNFDSDPADEIAISNYGGLVRIYNFAAGAMTELSRMTTEVGIESIAAHDVNSDGRVDLVIANSKAETVELFINQSSGFIRNRTITGVSSPSDIVIANLDGDSILDVAVTNLYGAGRSGFTLPSSATILGLTVTEREVQIAQEPIVENFGFAAVPQLQALAAQSERRLDVDRSGSITPRDALLVINSMSRSLRGEGEFGTNNANSRQDVNRDGRTTAVDALMIINYIARQRRVKSAEGETLTAPVDTELEKRHKAIDAAMSEVGGLF